MKLVIFACLAAVALAAPQFVEDRPFIAVLEDERTDQGDGNFAYRFRTEDGIDTNVVGVPGAAGTSVMNGQHSFTHPDGSVTNINFVADENGYRPEGEGIPAIPEHVFELLRIAEEQRAQGIQFDQRGFRIN